MAMAEIAVSATIARCHSVQAFRSERLLEGVPLAYLARTKERLRHLSFIELPRKGNMPVDIEETQLQRSGIGSRLAPLSGGLVLACVLVVFDVVVEGCYEASLLFCPLWFVASIGDALWKKTPHPIALRRILVPVVTLLLVLANYFVQTQIAWANAAKVIQACEKLSRREWCLSKPARTTCPALLELSSDGEILFLRRILVLFTESLACLG